MAKSLHDRAVVPPHGIGDAHRYLRADDLAQLAGLGIRSRFEVNSPLTGQHRSRMFGQSLEFVEHREYQPGDPVAHVDWKVYARSDRLFVKRFEQQSELNLTVLIDASASMGYRGEAPERKYDYACRVAAALAFLALRQQDRVSFAIAQSGLLHHGPSNRSMTQLDSILSAMDEARPARAARLPAALELLAERSSRGGLLVLITDLHDSLEDTMEALSMFSARQMEVCALHLLHPDEIELPDLSDVVVRDAETGQQVSLNVRDVRDDYRQRIDRHLQECRAAFTTRGMGYHHGTTVHSCAEAVHGLLRAREPGR